MSPMPPASALRLVAAALFLAGCQAADAPDPDLEPDRPTEPMTTAVPESGTTPDAPLVAAASDTLTVLFFGDSLTAGYGLPDQDLAYPALVGAEVEAALGEPVRVVNAGLSGETSAGGRDRVAWALRQNRPDVFVLALGGNDGLRGLDPAAMEANLEAIFETVREAVPEARLVIAGMEAPPNYGAEYTARFRAVFPDVAEAYDAALVPFLLDGVAGVGRLNQPDGIHPTAEGQRAIAETVAGVVVPEARRAAG